MYAQLQSGWGLMPNAQPYSMHTYLVFAQPGANKSTAPLAEQQICQPEDEFTPQINQPIMEVSLEDYIC